MDSTSVKDTQVAGAGLNTTSSASNPERNTDWADQVTDMFVDFIDNVRDKTTGPILKIARMMVYGLVALLLGVFVLIAGLIFLGRIISLIPIEEWISYSVLGIVFVLVGFLLWSKRKANP